MLAENSGFDPQDSVIKMQDELAKGAAVGLDVSSGEPIDPTLAGIYDSVIVKRQQLHSAPVIGSQLLLVDEVIRAGRDMRRG